MEKLKLKNKLKNKIKNKNQSKRFFLKQLFSFFFVLNIFTFSSFKKIKYSKKLWILDKKD